MFLDISRIRINKKENVKGFNQRFITLLNRIHDKPAEPIQIEFYTTSLPPLVSMFVKREEIKTSEEMFLEFIKVEKDLVAISHHLGNEESEASTLENNGKKNKEIELDGKDRVIFQLQTEIMNLKRSKEEGKKPFKKKNNTSTSPQIPPTLGINMEDYVMDNFCRTHYENHSEKACLDFINSFEAILIPWEPQEEDEEEEKG